MAKAWIHAKSSARKWGGKPEDYQDIHDFMDSSKAVVGDNRHRLLYHNAFAIYNIIPKVFGDTRINSDNKTYSTKDVAEQHCLEDFGGFIPSFQDYLDCMTIQPWMSGKGLSPSAVPVLSKKEIQD